MLKISKEIFESWNKEGVLYCHWKSNEHLLPGLNGETDLDVLLSRDCKDKGEKLLRSLDFLKCKSQYGSRYPDVDDWIGFDKVTGALIHLHLHYSIVTGHKGMKEYSLPWTDKALSTRVLNEDYGVYTIEPNLELVTLYTRIGLKVSIRDFFRKYTGQYKLTKDSKREIEWLKQKCDLKKVKYLLETYYGEYAKKMFALMTSDKYDSSTIFELRDIAEKKFSSVNRIGAKHRIYEFYYVFVYRFVKSLKNKINGYVISRKIPEIRKGLTIAFLGQDGAGKTTVTNDLMKWWRWKLDVRYTYLGSGDNYFSWRKTLLKILPNNIFFKIPRAWISFTKYTKLASDVLKYIKTGEEYAGKGGLQIFDRYPQIEYPGISDGPKLRKHYYNKVPRILRPLLLYYINKEEKILAEASAHHPNVVFKLILPPEESIRRKPQENLEAVTKKHEIIKSLKFEGSDVYTIDATMPYDEEIVMIKNIIWQHIQKL